MLIVVKWELIHTVFARTGKGVYSDTTFGKITFKEKNYY